MRATADIAIAMTPFVAYTKIVFGPTVHEDAPDTQEAATRGYDNGCLADLLFILVAAGIVYAVTNSAGLAVLAILGDLILDPILEYYFIFNRNALTRNVPNTFTIGAWFKNLVEVFNYIFLNGNRPSRAPEWV
jgi:hypothetical protein